MEEDKIKKRFAFVVASIGFFATLLGIYQYFDAKPSGDLTGQWNLHLEIKSTAYNPYKGLKIGYQIYFNQMDSNIKASGEKIMENGESLPISQRVKIDMDGRLSGNDLDLLFTLHGHKRETVGEFRLIAINDNKYQGTFSTTGANANGTVLLSRIVQTKN